MAPEDITGRDARGDGIDGAAPSAPAPDRSPNLRTGLIVLIGVILLGWALRAMTIVLVPLIAAVLIALAVMPVRDWIRARVPSWLGWLGITAAMTLILLIIGVFFGGLWLAAQRVVAELPTEPGEIVQSLQENAGAGGSADLAQGAAAGAVEGAEEGGGVASEAAEGGAEPSGEERAATLGEAAPGGVAPGGAGAGAGGSGFFGALPGSAENVVRMIGDRAAGAASGVAVTILNSALNIVAGLVLIFFLTLLILVESGVWRRKVQAIARPWAHWRLTESADVIAEKVRMYLVLRTILGLATAALYGIWLWWWGVGLLLVWTVLTFLMNFIPTLGSLIAGILPVVYALLTQDLTTALIVGAGILVIEQVMGNYVDPRLEGSHHALSPLVILVSLLFWGWVWGISGTLIAVPVTVALVVLASHVPALRPWALMLTDRTSLGELDEVTRPEE